MSDAIPRDVPFSLSCTECDCDSPDTYEDALSDGWTQIEYYPEGSSENFLGLCPDCRREEEQKQAQIRQWLTSDETEGGGPCPT
jgi:hypothetical protein